jgi:CBS domain-containing protein
MKAGDIMTSPAITVDPDRPVRDVAKLMAERRISAVPVVDSDDHVLGIVSEGDLLRGAETGTQRRRSWWLERIASSRQPATEQANPKRRCAEVMTRDVVTVEVATSIKDIARLLEERCIKRVPVIRRGRLVGIVSRANLVQALASGGWMPSSSSETSDRTIREALLAELGKQNWTNSSPGTVVVTGGIVHLWGYALSDKDHQVLRAAAKNVPGVRGVEDHTSGLLTAPLL